MVMVLDPDPGLGFGRKLSSRGRVKSNPCREDEAKLAVHILDEEVLDEILRDVVRALRRGVDMVDELMTECEVEAQKRDE